MDFSSTKYIKRNKEEHNASVWFIYHIRSYLPLFFHSIYMEGAEYNGVYI